MEADRLVDAIGLRSRMGREWARRDINAAVIGERLTVDGKGELYRDFATVISPSRQSDCSAIKRALASEETLRGTQ